MLKPVDAVDDERTTCPISRHFIRRYFLGLLVSNRALARIGYKKYIGSFLQVLHKLHIR
jgi:hypothetical protein